MTRERALVVYELRLRIQCSVTLLTRMNGRLRGNMRIFGYLNFIFQLLSFEDFNKFIRRRPVQSQAASNFQCETVNCTGWCPYEDNVNTFTCPVCDKMNCLTCKAIHQPEMNCKEYQEDLNKRAKTHEGAREMQRFFEVWTFINCPGNKAEELDKRNHLEWIMNQFFLGSYIVSLSPRGSRSQC